MSELQTSIDVGQLPIAEQVGIDPVRRAAVGGPRPGKIASRPIFRHQPLHPLAIDRLPGTLQRSRHPPAAVERGQEELLIDQPHQAQVLLRLGRRREVGR